MLPNESIAAVSFVHIGCFALKMIFNLIYLYISMTYSKTASPLNTYIQKVQNLSFVKSSGRFIWEAKGIKPKLLYLLYICIGSVAWL